MKIFISQPMKGRKPEQIEKVRENMVAFAAKSTSEPIEVIDSYIPEAVEQNPIVCLGQSIIKMAEADKVYFARGWETARGCAIEKRVCESYGIPYVLTSIGA